jgi:hypothetical protein
MMRCFEWIKFEFMGAGIMLRVAKAHHYRGGLSEEL